MSEQNVLTTLTKDGTIVKSWLLLHEKLIGTFLVLALLFFIVYKVFDLASVYENHKASQAQTALDIQKAKNDADLLQAKQMLATYEATIAQSKIDNAKLIAAITARDKQLATQQQTDAHLQPSDLASRWQGFVGDSGIVPNASGYDVSTTAAISTVQNLEQIPVLKQNLVDEQTKELNLQKDVDKGNDLIGQGKIVVNGLQLQLTDKAKQCTTEIAAVKADARKGKLKAFGFGYVAGLLTGVVVHFF